jgi:AraC-like DNA-binding protein
MDRLAPFFDRFALTARMFYSGLLCGTLDNRQSEHASHLHVLKNGTLKIRPSGARQIVLNTPSLLFYPRPRLHRLSASEQEGAELMCATVEFGAGMLNPLIASLPEPLFLPVNALPELAPAVELLFSEAFSDAPGRQPAIDRLFEYVFVLLIRSAMNRQLVDSGILMGLSNPRLASAIEAMHRQPQTSWSLEQLAQLAGMSRARFAVHFRQVVGVTPFDYLTRWRLGVAQTMLRKGSSLKVIAPAVGYTNATALTRVFTHHFGISPSEWLGRSKSPDK